MELSGISDENIKLLYGKLQEKNALKELLQERSADTLKSVKINGQTIFNIKEKLPANLAKETDEYSNEYITLYNLYNEMREQLDNTPASQIQFQTISTNLNLNLINPIDKLASKMNILLGNIQPYLQTGGRKRKNK